MVVMISEPRSCRSERRVVREHAEALKVLAEHDPARERAKR